MAEAGGVDQPDAEVEAGGGTPNRDAQEVLSSSGLDQGSGYG